MSQYKDIDAVTLKQWMDNGEKLRLVDVRSPAEMAQGMIEHSEAMPLHLVPIHNPVPEEGGKLVLVCRTGARSGHAAMFIAGKGIDEVYNLQGGVFGWVRSGSALIIPDASALSQA